MAETQPTQVQDQVAHQDAPHGRVTLLDTLPEKLADDVYVRYLAGAADDARADRDETRTQLFELLRTSAQLESELRTIKAKRPVWAPVDVLAVIFVAAWAVFIIGMFVVPTIIQAVGS